MIDDGIMHETWRHLCTKTRKKDDVGIVSFDLIGLLPTNHIIAHITMAYRSFRGNVQCEKFINSQTTKNILKFYWHKVESTRNCKLRQLSGRFQTLTWRQGETVQNQESPRLFGRVDSTTFLPSGFYRTHHCKSKSQHSILEVTLLGCPWEQCPIKKYMYLWLYWKRPNGGQNSQEALCVPFPPSMGANFCKEGTGHFRSSQVIWRKQNYCLELLALYLQACVQTAPPLGKNWRRGICDSRWLIVYGNNFA